MATIRILQRSCAASKTIHYHHHRGVANPNFTARALSSFHHETNDIERVNASKESMVTVEKTPDGRGWGLFARQDISKGTRVFHGKAVETSPNRTSHSIQTDWNTHVLMDVPAVLINHSCDANVGIRGPNEFGAYDFHALEDVEAGDELLWDYETAESTISEFTCTCGTLSCRGVLKGFDSEHRETILNSYGKEYIAPYLLEEK